MIVIVSTDHRNYYVIRKLTIVKVMMHFCRLSTIQSLVLIQGKRISIYRTESTSILRIHITSTASGGGGEYFVCIQQTDKMITSMRFSMSPL